MTTFMQQLKDLQWTLLEGGRCKTATGWDLNIWSLTVTQFDETAHECWEKLLVPKLAKLRTLHDIKSFSVGMSAFPRNADAIQEGFARKFAWVGSFRGTVKGWLTRRTLLHASSVVVLMT